MKAIRYAVTLLTMVATLGLAAPAAAYDAKETFKKGALAVAVEGGHGEQDNFEAHGLDTGLEFWNAGIRLSTIPFGPSGPGPLWGALEVGLEPFYQRYMDPLDAFFAGVGVALRYHFLSLGRVVPYLEAFAAAGGTDLETLEIDSNFTFLLHAGAGLSVFITDRAAVYAGYRLQHVSNGNTAEPNRGFESHGVVVGVSYFFR
jgi:hypothetical protein